MRGISQKETRKEPDASSFEERVFARFDAIDARLTALEEKVEARLYDTRPLWESVQIELRRINAKLDQVVTDLFETRANQTVIDKRVTQLEESR